VLSPKQWVQGYIESSPYKKKHFYKIVAISDMVKQDMMRWYGVAEEKIAVVYNGVDIERFHPRNRQYRKEIRGRHGIGAQDLVILFVSNNFQMKGLGFLIRALAKIKRENLPPFKLLILGRDRPDSYLRTAREMMIDEEMVFAGSTDEPEKYYGASDLLVHPTFYDACSLTVLEALASGIPVITTRCNGASGIVTQGQEGFVISDPRDDRALAEKILFFSNREKLERASIAARHLAESYSLERNWREMEHILLDDLPKGGPSE
jgi:UDP-glucose:(heptosyl)LPS alpha-1,3-glucosyltransferase